MPEKYQSMKNNIKKIYKVFIVASFLIFTVTASFAQVKALEVEWGGVGCYKIEMPMGTVYFEKDNGVSGFKSFEIERRLPFSSRYGSRRQFRGGGLFRYVRWPEAYSKWKIL